MCIILKLVTHINLYILYIIVFSLNKSISYECKYVRHMLFSNDIWVVGDYETGAVA